MEQHTHIELNDGHPHHPSTLTIDAATNADDQTNITIGTGCGYEPGEVTITLNQLLDIVKTIVEDSDRTFSRLAYERAHGPGSWAEREAVKLITAQVVEREQPALGLCEWFAMCTRDAVTYRVHPILGNVPICSECNDKIEEMSK